MSLVGTRPPTVDEYEQYEIGHRKRLTGVGALGLVPILYCVRLLRSIAWMKCWEISLERTAVCF